MVGDVSAASVDGLYHVTVGGHGNEPFDVDGQGRLIVTGPLDFETTPVFELTLFVLEASVPTQRCPIAANVTVIVNIVDEPEVPKLQLSATTVSVADELAYPWDSSAVFTVVAWDVFADNTSAITARVHSTDLVEDLQGITYHRRAKETFFDLVSIQDGGPCRGGIECALQVSVVAPRIDFDSGLRSMVLVLEAVGGTNLTTLATVVLIVSKINERTCRMRPSRVA